MTSPHNLKNYNVNKSEQEINSKVDHSSVQLVSYMSQPSKSLVPVTRSRNGNLKNEIGNPEEKESFIISSTPVKLDPGFESRDRNADIQLPVIKSAFPPPDRYYIVFFIFLIHGVGVLMPWNMFITAKSYFEDYKLNTTISKDATYRTEFMFYLGIVSQVSNALVSCINTFFQFGGQPSTRRIAISLFFLVVIFIFTVVLAMIDTTKMPFVFFGLTMASASLMNCFAGVYQNSVFGQAAILPMKYTNAIVLGTNLSGIFTSVINLISIAGSPNHRIAAVYYFIVAIIILLIAFDCYFILPLTKFYQHYMMTVHGDVLADNKSMKCYDYINAFISSCKTYWVVIKKIWLQLFGVWCVFCVTLMLFPAIQSNVKMIRQPFLKNDGNSTNETHMRTVLFPEDFEKDGYWVSIFCFLSFNMFAFIGNMVSTWIKWPGPKRVWIPIVLRAVILIPVYVLCNYQPTGVQRNFPVFIESDIVYIIAAIIMAFTSGYYSSLSMMYGPKEVDSTMAGRAGMMMAFFLVLGITSGVNLSLVLQKLVTHIPQKLVTPIP